jgi:DNA repair protein RecO (recombination protein O)
MEQTEAILIRKQGWSDTSLITTWFTAGHGKISAVARSARRAGSPFAGSLDLFHKVEIAYVPPKRGTLATLREVRILSPFESTSTANVFLCGYFAELIDLSTQPGDSHPDVFDLLQRGISHLNTTPASMRALVFFETELCRILGIEDSNAHVLHAIETYCGKIPASRMPAVKLLSKPGMP